MVRSNIVLVGPVGGSDAGGRFESARLGKLYLVATKTATGYDKDQSAELRAGLDELLGSSRARR